MNFDKAFKKQSALVQVLLLICPIVNWVTEVLVRASAWTRSKSTIKLVFLIVVIFGGLLIGWLDAIWQLLFGHLILE